MSDDEKRPSWAESDADWQLWLDVKARVFRLGHRSVFAGWSNVPEPHGEVVLDRGVVRTSAPTVMEAVRMMDGVLSSIEDINRIG